MSSPITSESRSVRNLASLWEIAVAYGLILGALWTLGNERYAWSLAALVWIVAVTLYRRPSLAQIGMGTAGLRRSSWLIAAGLAFAAVAVLAGWIAGTLHDYSRNGVLATRAIGYLLWSFEQEFILQSFIFFRLEALLGRGVRPVVVAAILFSAAHLPSPVLTAGSLVMAGVFCTAFQRYRNLYPLAIVHWLIGLSLSLVLPDWIARHMRVGIGYLHFVAR